MIVLIPLGGIGSRFKTEGFKNIKPFINIHGKPILYYLIDKIDADYIYIPYNKELKKYNFEERLRTDFPKINFKFLCLSKNTRGASETIKIALDNLTGYDEQILCLDGDSFYNIDIVKKWNKGNQVFCMPEKERDCFSFIKFVDTITNIKEKEKISDWACTGAYGFRSWKTLKRYCNQIIDKNIMDKGEFYISTVIGEMIKDNIKFFPGCITKNDFISLGTPQDMLKFYDICILFDLDGTLINTDEAYVNTWKELLDPYGYQVDKQWFDINVKGKSDFSVFSKLFPDHSWNTTNPNFKELSHKKDNIFLKNIKNLTPIYGAIEFVQNCILFGIQCGIVTNCNRESAVNILKHFDIYDCMKTLIIGDECSRPKPFPDPYLKGKNHFDNKLCIVFEDTPTGIQSAKACGADFIIGVETSYSKDVLKSHGADFSIKDFKCDIFSIIRMIETDRIGKSQEYNHLKGECKRILKENVKFEKMFLKGGYIANIQRIFTDNDSYVIKRENESNHTFNTISKNLKLYEREYYFYEQVSKLVPLKVPKYYGTIYKNGTKKGIILEDLNNNFTFNPSLNNDGLNLILKRVAEMHHTFWDNTLLDQFDLQINTDSLFKPEWQNFCKQRWPIFKEKWSEILSFEQLDIGEKILNNFSKIQESLSKPPLTLVHGDLKIPNIAMYNNGKPNQEPYFLDWQYIVKGKGIQDIAFLLIESFDIQDHERILNQYLKYLNLDYNYKEDFKNALCYFPFYVAMWFGTVDDKDLIDVTFPKKYIPKLFKIYEHYKI